MFRARTFARAGLAGGAIGFVLIALTVRFGLLTGMEDVLLMFFRDPQDVRNALGPDWFEDTVMDMSTLGGYPVMITLALMAMVALALVRRYADVLFLAGTIAFGSIVSTGLKLVFDRARPDFLDHLDRTYTSSFPSAHAMMSMVVWLALAAVAAQHVSHQALRVFIFGAAISVSIMVGVTRVYLGVHWPSDVVAGWCAGIAWVGLCWLIYERALIRYRYGGAEPDTFIP